MGKANPPKHLLLPAAQLPRHTTKRSSMLIDESLRVEQEDARKAGALGYMARTLAQVTLPHRDQGTALYFERSNGKVTLAVRGHKTYGLPYGTLPRLVLAWISTEAVRTQSPTLELGRSAAEFARKLSLHYNGRDLGRLKRQCLALARSVISIDGVDKQGLAFDDLKIANRGFVFWNDDGLERPTAWESTLTLTPDFYIATTSSPVPLDLRVYHALKKSPLAMDIYTWLTYRIFLLSHSGHPKAMIPWTGLKLQFGGNYAHGEQGLRDFKKAFNRRLREVLLFYPAAEEHVIDAGDHLKLTPCSLHIPHNKGTKLSNPRAS